jgi:hypothetical protein
MVVCLRAADVEHRIRFLYNDIENLRVLRLNLFIFHASMGLMIMR